MSTHICTARYAHKKDREWECHPGPCNYHVGMMCPACVSKANAKQLRERRAWMKKAPPKKPKKVVKKSKKKTKKKGKLR